MFQCKLISIYLKSWDRVRCWSKDSLRFGGQKPLIQSSSKEDNNSNLTCNGGQHLALGVQNMKRSLFSWSDQAANQNKTRLVNVWDG